MEYIKELVNLIDSQVVFNKKTFGHLFKDEGLLMELDFFKSDLEVGLKSVDFNIDCCFKEVLSITGIKLPCGEKEGEQLLNNILQQLYVQEYDKGDGGVVVRKKIVSYFYSRYLYYFFKGLHQVGCEDN